MSSLVNVATGSRSGRRIVVETDAVATERRPLLACHVRSGGESTPHVCNICLSTMWASRESTPNWVQAPCCGEVWHERCILRYAREADSTLSCPQCKTQHAACDVDDWSIEDVIDRLFPTDAYDQDGAHEREHEARPHTRSQGAPKEWRRRTRSSGMYL